jgi:chromosome segregation ATPase
MDEPTLPQNRTTAEECFRALETQIASLRALAKSLREDRPSWSDTVFHPGRRARQEAEFSTATVTALKEFRAAMRQAFAERETQRTGQESKLAELERQVSDFQRQLSDFQRQLSDLQRQASEFQESELVGIRTELNQVRQQTEEVRDQQERLVREHAEASKSAAELNQKVADGGRDQDARFEQLSAGQKELANEFRERIQHLLDEQRVTIRQLALKASEDAVLADRARRALELKLEELAKRLPPG